MALNPTKITEVAGTVKMKRRDGSTWIPVSASTEIHLGDLLKKEPGASVTVVCSSGKTGVAIPDGRAVGLNFICPTIFRNGSDSAIPYSLSPRDTLILTNKPILRWHAPDGANNFKVTVRGGELVEWTREVSRTEACQGNICELVYPGDKPLQPGVSYKLVIETTDTGRSSEEITAPGLGFKLIDDDKALEVQKNAKIIQEEGLSAQKLALKLADLYVDFNLLAEAIATLEASAQKEKNATVYRRLGEFYHLIALPLEAESEYLEAVEQAKAAGNKLELAAAQAGLGEVNWTLGRKDEARSFLEASKETYTALGDADMISYLEERLHEMAAD